MFSDQFPILQFLWFILISFVCSFAKNFNDYALYTRKDKKFVVFISEIILSGICGVLLGALCKYLIDNIYLVSFSCGIGGIFGLKSLQLGGKILLNLKNLGNLTNDIDQLNEKDKNQNKK